MRSILESLVSHGAPEKILVDGKPHLGTDKLIVILRNIRAFLVQQGKQGHSVEIIVVLIIGNSKNPSSPLLHRYFN